MAGPGSRHVDAISSYVEILPPSFQHVTTRVGRAGKGHKLNICIVEKRGRRAVVSKEGFVFFFFFFFWKGKEL